MRAHQMAWNASAGWSGILAADEFSDLVLFFGTRAGLACGERYNELRNRFPEAHIIGCSTGGQIQNSGTASVTADALPRDPGEALGS